jgi:hypothetical protein
LGYIRQWWSRHRRYRYRLYRCSLSNVGKKGWEGKGKMLVMKRKKDEQDAGKRELTIRSSSFVVVRRRSHANARWKKNSDEEAKKKLSKIMAGKSGTYSS